MNRLPPRSSPPDSPRPAAVRAPDGETGRSLRAGEVLVQTIGRRIVMGEFPPGDILPNEAAWAREFGVSRSVVREAIKTLAGKGLLTSRPKIGTAVAPRNRWSLLDHDMLSWLADAPGRPAFLDALQEFRRIFEPEAAALAALRRTQAQMDEIDSACWAMGHAASLLERTRADARFHMAILEASGNQLLLPLGVLIESALRNLFVAITREAGDLRYAQELHEAIALAIARQDADAARLAVRRLLQNSDDMVEKLNAG